MSVDGEIWTDLQKVPQLIRLCGSNASAAHHVSWRGSVHSAAAAPVSYDCGIVAMAITASKRGEGCTRALNSVLKLQSPSLAVRSLSAFVASAGKLSQESGNELPAQSERCSTLRIDILYADYYSIATWHRSMTLPMRQGRLWVVAVDDVSAVRAFLAANDKLESFRALVGALSSAGGVLLTTTAPGGGNLPREIASRAALTLTYRIGGMSAAVRERMLREDDTWLPNSTGRAVAAECATRPGGATGGHDGSGAISRGGFCLAVTLAADVEGGTVDATWLPPRAPGDQRRGAAAAAAAVGAVSRLEPLRARGGGAEGSAASIAVRYAVQPEPPLYGLDELKARLVLLCQLHAARFGSTNVEDGADTTEAVLSLGGSVARKAEACTGVLLRGPPGVGKTALVRSVARVLATSHGVPTLLVQGSQLYAKYLGESEGRLRHVFAQARRMRPCVVAIEDIDAIARSRRLADHESTSGGGSGSSNHGGVDVTKRMLAALLCELDGVSGNEGVLVLATSSRPEGIDSALLRQGRLEVVLDVPPMNASALRDMCRDFVERLVGLADSASTEATAGRIAALAAEAGVRQANELQMAFRLVVESVASESNDDSAAGVPTDEVWRKVCAEVVGCRDRATT